MGDERVRIRRLALRVPGLTADEGRGFGAEVARRVGEGLPARMRSRHLGALEIRVVGPPGASRSRLVTLVAEAVLKGME